MVHVPHLHVPGPWAAGPLILQPGQEHHLRRVLRMADGETVTYTDGAGRMGTGALRAATVVRGPEIDVRRPHPRLTLAVAPPRGRDRTREVVEKLAELGVDRLVWLTTRRGEGRLPHPAKAATWAAAALEQSRGVHLLEMGGPDVPAALAGAQWVADPHGAPPPRSVTDDLVVLVGPEGGFASGEVPARAVAVGLGERVLRVGTAAVAAAVVALDRMGRLGPPGGGD